MIHTYRIRASDMVMCTIHQDKTSGVIKQVVFTADDGKGCPVTSSIGEERINSSDSQENINLLDIWRASNPVQPNPTA